MQIKIPTEATIAACEEALQLLSETTTDAEIDLVTTHKYQGAGGDLSWAQLLLTWAQKSEHRTLRTYLGQNPTSEKLQSVCSSLLNLIAILCSDKVENGQQQRQDETLLSKSEAINQLSRLQTKRADAATKGPSISVVAADSLGFGSPDSLYVTASPGHKTLGNRDYFVRASDRIFKRIAPNDRKLHSNPLISNAFGTLLYELFKNTEDHALQDIDGKRLAQCFRVFRADYVSMEKNSLLNSTADYAPLNAYYDQFMPGQGRKHLNFISLSVLDSGPGYAQTWTRQPFEELTEEEEKAATIRCFSNGTSKHSDRYGKGLPLTRNILRQQKGFLRLRTGRQSLFYSGSNDLNPDIEIPLHSWAPQSNVKLARVHGTLISILLPVSGTK